jgi:Uma2 family endonuclease
MAPPGLSIDERVEVPSSVFDHTGFRRWATSDLLPDDVRVSYANGEVLLEMSRPALETHSKVKGELTSVLVQLVKVEDRGETYPDRALLTNEAAELSTEPDFVFVSWSAFDAGRVRLVPKANRPDDFIEIEGTPDLVIEVVSDSSKRKDTELLRAAYARAGVPEYWLVDARSASLSFVILHLSAAGTSYEQAVADGEPQPSKVLERSFSLHRARNRIGRWSYTLTSTRRS